MKERLSSFVSRLIVKPGDTLAKDAQSSIHLVFSPAHARFVAVKMYRRDFLADQRMLRAFQETGSGLRTNYVPGVAFPLEFGMVEARFYQATELLPGSSLQRILETSGPLNAESVIRLGRLILPMVRRLVEDHGIRPVLQPERVQLWASHDRENSWKAGLGDFDPRPARNPWSAASEESALEDLLSLMTLAQGGHSESVAFCYTEFWNQVRVAPRPALPSWSNALPSFPPMLMTPHR